jgi:hypothetical protein
MPAWLGAALAGLFAAVGVYRVRCRDVPGAVMALGMAAMAAGMGGIGPHLVHGPWWAAAFGVVALWPAYALVRQRRTLPSRNSLVHGHLPHVVGGVAMVYMCVAGLSFVAAPAAPVPGPAAGADTVGYELTAVHDHHSAGSALAAAGVIGGPESLAVGLFALLGWLLAGYFLFAAVCVLTRRGPDARPVCTRRAVAEAAMSLGTIVMLVAVI